MSKIHVGWAVKHVEETLNENDQPHTLVWWEVLDTSGDPPPGGIPLYVEDEDARIDGSGDG